MIKYKTICLDYASFELQNFQGIEIEIILEMARELDWNYGSEWQFACMQSMDDLIQTLKEDEKAFAGISGFTIGNFFIEKYGFSFTQSYFQNTITFLTKGKYLKYTILT